jgi:hypothetical protein
VKSDAQDESPSRTPEPYDRRIPDYCAGLLTRVPHMRAYQLAQEVRLAFGIEITTQALVRRRGRDGRFAVEYANEGRHGQAVFAAEAFHVNTHCSLMGETIR